MKKIIALIVSLMLVMSFVSCDETGDITNDKNVANTTEVVYDEGTTEKTESDLNTTGLFEDSENVSENSEEISLTETVIYETNNIRITVKGLEFDSLMGPEISVLIENNSDKNITVQTRNSSINGLMVDTVMSADVAASKKANDSITFYSSDLETAGIGVIKDIEFSLHIIDSDTWDNIDDSDMIVLKTSAPEDYVQSYDDSGYVAYDSEGIKIVIKKLNSSDSFWGADLYLYIENNTEENITVQTRDESVNGFMIDPYFSSEVVSGKKVIDTITFMESDLTDNGIKDITDMEMIFHIFNTETWDTIIDTDVINVTFE